MCCRPLPRTARRLRRANLVLFVAFLALGLVVARHDSSLGFAIISLGSASAAVNTPGPQPPDVS